MYTLVASNASGMLSKSVTVNVLSAQVVKPELQVVNKKPDLLFYPSSLGIDEVNRIIYTMKNGGQGKSAPCINALFVDGIWVATSNINYSLNPGNFVTLTIGGTLLPSPLEPHVFEVRLDAYYTNDESNENNNSRSASFNYKLK
jgi:subtilase family serine protease